MLPLGQAQPCLNRMTVKKNEHFSVPPHVMWCDRHAQRNADAMRVSLVSPCSSLRFRNVNPVTQRAICGVERETTQPHGG